MRVGKECYQYGENRELILYSASVPEKTIPNVQMTLEIPSGNIPTIPLLMVTFTSLNVPATSRLLSERSV